MILSFENLELSLLERKHTLKQVLPQYLLVTILAPGDTSLNRIIGWIRDKIATHRATLGGIRLVLDTD